MRKANLHLLGDLERPRESMVVGIVRHVQTSSKQTRNQSEDGSFTARGGRMIWSGAEGCHSDWKAAKRGGVKNKVAMATNQAPFYFPTNLLIFFEISQVNDLLEQFLLNSSSFASTRQFYSAHLLTQKPIRFHRSQRAWRVRNMNAVFEQR